MKPEGEVRQYHSGALPFAVDVYLDTYDGPSWVKKHLRGRAGWLQVARASLVTPISDWSATIVSAVTDDGQRLGKLSANAFLAMRSSMPELTFDDPPEELDALTDLLFWDFLGSCDLRHLDMLAQAEAALATELQTEQIRGERVLAEADRFVTELRRRRRKPDNSAEQRAAIDSKIALMEEKSAAASGWLVRHLAGIRDKGVALELDVMEALENHGEYEVLYAARWVARSRYDRVADPILIAALKQQSLGLGATASQPMSAKEAREHAERVLRDEPILTPYPTHPGDPKAHLPIWPPAPVAPEKSKSDEAREAWRREEKALLAELDDWKADEAAMLEVESATPRRRPSTARNLSEPFPGRPDVATEDQVVPAATGPDSLDIGALIETGMRDLLKDVKT